MYFNVMGKPFKRFLVNFLVDLSAKKDFEGDVIPPWCFLNREFDGNIVHKFKDNPSHLEAVNPVV